jgi:hypothetical protein
MTSCASLELHAAQLPAAELAAAIEKRRLAQQGFQPHRRGSVR